MAERKNRALIEMVNSLLPYSGLSDRFWGKAMLTVCYLLNKVPNKRNNTTPYEIWYKKRPNLLFLRVWVCRPVVRLLDPERKTLGEKGIDFIFVGYAKHSKAYRFYVIEPNDYVFINSIIESKDAIFDENCFSSIPRLKDIIPNSVESQRDDHSDDVPSETPEPRKEVELQQNDLIKTLRTDRGGEYYDLVFFQSVGIIHETTAPYIPQQNGMAERKNRALKETVNSMLSYSGLSEGF
nr:zinc finger, CCHC-type [Tanacetum cinerariifolium]